MSYSAHRVRTETELWRLRPRGATRRTHRAGRTFAKHADEPVERTQPRVGDPFVTPGCVWVCGAFAVAGYTAGVVRRIVCLE